MLLLAYGDQDQLIACGGLNQQWGENEIEGADWVAYAVLCAS